MGKADLGTPSESQLKEAEEKFYKNYIKTEDFKIKFNKKKEFENYKYILRSKVIVGFSSTMLRKHLRLIKFYALISLILLILNFHLGNLFVKKEQL